LNLGCFFIFQKNKLFVCFLLFMWSNKCKIIIAAGAGSWKGTNVLTREKVIYKLAKQARHGNINAYGELIELHKEYLYRTAYLYTKNEENSLDIVQECVLKGFRTIASIRKPEYFKTWITRILINVVNDFYKKHNLTVSFDEIEFAVADKTNAVEEKWDLYEAIDRLSEKQRTVIILKYFDGLKIGEIAYAMSIPEGSVSAYLTRAKEELRHYLKEDYQYEL